MIKEFRSMDAKERKVELSDGRIMPLDDMIKDYERLLNEVNSKKVITPEPNKEIPKDAVMKVDEIGESSTLELGDTVFAIGSPLGSKYMGTVTKGIIATAPG